MAEATTADVRREAPALAGRLRRWIGSGALQSPAGAFCAWRNADDGELAFEYPEITGYALTWLAGRDQLDDRERRAGLAAAEWVSARLAAGNYSARDGWDGQAVYTFDLGMIAAGLTSFGRRLEIGRYEDLGVSLGQELGRLVDDQAGLAPITGERTATERPPQWSTAGRAHLVKCTQALLLAGEDDAAARLVRHNAGSWGEDGHFMTEPGGRMVMLHPHLYAVEGLWIWGRARRDEASLEAARRATAWAWQHQLGSGGFPRWVANGEIGPEQFDATAQAIRAAILLEVPVANLDAAVARLQEVARAEAANGSALPYSMDGARTHLNAWTTMFGAQALWLVGNGPELDWRHLV